jgi:hypothetical protein
LMSDYSPRSFDGRYFGPVAQTSVKGVLRPVFTMGPPAKGPAAPPQTPDPGSLSDLDTGLGNDPDSLMGG